VIIVLAVWAADGIKASSLGLYSQMVMLQDWICCFGFGYVLKLHVFVFHVLD
jgi:hypothetical protein